MALPDTLSHFSPHPGPDIPLDIAICHACLSPEWKKALQQAFMSDPEMYALANIIITSWPDDIKAVPHPLHPYWGDPHHWRWPCPLWRSPHCPSFGKGESATTTPPVSSRDHQSPVACMWMHFLAWHKQSHQRSCLSVWNLHPVPSP